MTDNLPLYKLCERDVIACDSGDQVEVENNFQKICTKKTFQPRKAPIVAWDVVPSDYYQESEDKLASTFDECVESCRMKENCQFATFTIDPSCLHFSLDDTGRVCL